MADFTALKTAIQNAIKQNGNEEITGNLLQDVLLAIVTTLGEGNINNLINSLDAEVTARQQAVSAEAQARQLADSTLQGGINTVSAAITAINNAIGNGCVYAGIATPSSTPASGKVFYLALTAGTYTNYGGLEVPQGINILKNNGYIWSLDSFLGIDDAPTPSSNNLIKSGGAFDFVMKNGSAFDLSAYNNGTTYADLNAALTALNALPAAYKKGGMSLKYVQSSDNNYTQFRCKTQSFSADPEDWYFEENVTLVENPEYIAVYTDAVGKIIIAVENDGNIHYGAGVPRQVIDYINTKIAELSLDEYEDIVDFLGSLINGDKTLANLLSEKVDKEPGKSLIPTQYIQEIENNEYQEVHIDSENKIYFAIGRDGRLISPTITEIKETIERIESNYSPINSIVEKSPEIIGSKFTGNNLSLSSSYLISLEDSYAEKRSWLTKICFNADSTGDRTVYLGYTDQRGIFIPRISFIVSASIIGINEIDISDKHIIIEVGEKPFISGGVKFATLDAADDYPNMIYGLPDGTFEGYDSPNGASTYMTWETIDVSALYPFVSDFEEVKSSLAETTELTNNINSKLNKVYDSEGNAYKLKVQNGQLVPILQQFSKCLVIGNSVTKHGYSSAETTMWLSSDKGMAATTINNDFCHYIEDGLKTKVPLAEVTRGNGVQWERNLYTDHNTLMGLLDSYTDNYDLIVFACEENIRSTVGNDIYISAKEFFKVIMEKWPNAELVITSNRLNFGGNPSQPFSYKDNALIKAANELNLSFIDVRQFNYDEFCKNFRTGEWIPMYCEGDSEPFVVQKIVSSHTTDIGMLRIANAILKGISYPTIDNVQHNIVVSCSQSYYAPSYWVENGLVTVLLYDSIPSSAVVLDSSENQILCTIKDMTSVYLYETPSRVPKAAVIFNMPNSNVSVTIS